MPLDVVSAILFSPRGGSAHAARALAGGLRADGHAVTLLAGSRSDLGDDGDARAFYGDVVAVDFGPALASGTPMQFEGPPGTAPMHPSFEDRAGAPDRVFAALDDLAYERQVRAWARELDRAGAAGADVLHLHHLTPLNEAADRVAPRVPVVGQLHGTELLMLEAIDAGPPPGWLYADRWAARLRRWAGRCARLVVAPGGLERACRVLRLPPERFVPLPGGVDTDAFRALPVDRAGVWRRALVDEPRAWRPGEPPGSVRYAREDVNRLDGATVLLYVGRFTAVKRLDVLIEAFADGAARARSPAALVLVGGHPGEWEGEHPLQIVERLGVPNVFLAGWHTHSRLPEFMCAADAVVLASSREQFGQVLVEAMACERPPVATRSAGPRSIIDDGITGWLVERDDPDALAAAFVEVVDGRSERERRGKAGRSAVCERFSWKRVAEALADVLRAAAREDAPEASSA